MKLIKEAVGIKNDEWILFNDVLDELSTSSKNKELINRFSTFVKTTLDKDNERKHKSWERIKKERENNPNYARPKSKLKENIMKLLKEEKEIHIFEQEEPEWSDISWYFEDDGLNGKDGGYGLLIIGNRDYKPFLYTGKYDTQPIKDAYEDSENKEEFIEKLKEITGKDYKRYTLTGYSQSDWQDAYYPAGEFTKEWLEEIEDAYFGNYSSFYDTTEDVGGYVVFDSDRRNIKEILSEQSGVPAEDIKVRKISGYHKVPDYIEESCKSKKKSKKLNETWKGEDVIDDLVDRAQSLIDDGNYGDVDDCIRQAIDDGLIYSRDVWDLAEHYGVVDDSELIDRYYEELFSDIYSRVEEKKEDEDEEIDESLKENKKNLKENIETFRDDVKSYYKLYKDGMITSDEYSKKFKELKKKHLVKDSDFKNWKNLDESLHVEIDEDDALEMLMTRLSHWTQDPITEELYEQMYQSYIDGGVFDNGKFDVMAIVDNDWVNYCEIVEPGDEEHHYDELLKLYEEQGLGDVSTEDVGFSYIEAAVERNGKVYFLCRW